jgi:hypothetical protein
MSADNAMDYGLYVLIEDSAGNRTPGAQAPNVPPETRR